MFENVLEVAIDLAKRVRRFKGVEEVAYAHGVVFIKRWEVVGAH